MIGMPPLLLQLLGQHLFALLVLLMQELPLQIKTAFLLLLWSHIAH